MQLNFSNRWYDGLKWCVLVFLPAISVFIGGIGPVIQWESSEKWVTVINLMAVFLGSLMQVSSINYHNQGGGNYAVHTRLA